MHFFSQNFVFVIFLILEGAFFYFFKNPIIQIKMYHDP